MTKNWTRREVLQSTVSSAGILAAGGLRSLNRLRASERSTASVEDADIERLAERIIDSPPEAVVDLVIRELEDGVSRQELLAACLNAGARFHGHHSAYVAHPIRVVSDAIGLEASALPLFYYLSVLRFRARRSALHWLDKSKLPPAQKAEAVFHAAMQAGEREDAGLAMISLCREFGPRQAYQHLWMYGAERNHRSGGHTAVSVVNTFRTLQATDWRCAETALQFAVTDEAWRTPGGSDVRAVNRNRASRAGDLPRSWPGATSDAGHVRELMNLYREGRPADACAETFDRLRQGQVVSGSVWDALFLTTAEMVVRYQWTGSKRLAGHSITCVNALHFLFRSVVDTQTRLYSLLEAVEWTTSFLDRERARPALREFDLLSLKPVDSPDGNDALDGIFALLPPRRFAAIHRPDFADVDVAMRRAHAWILKNPDPEAFLRRALWLMCVKSTPEVHDFKYPMALFENCRQASPQWRPFLLAASVHVLHGTDMEDSLIVQQAIDRLG